MVDKRQVYLVMLCIRHYKKTYGEVTVLQVEQLRLDTGIYWLRGANGTGKTTLLKSIAGLLPFKGEIEADGLSLRKNRMAYTRKVSFAEAEPVYPSFLTGNDLMQFYLQTKGGTRVQLTEMANLLGIAPYLANAVGTYSSGMQKKLSLLLGFAGTPSLVLLDEPFVTLDIKAVEVLRSLIADYSNRSVSFLISSHQPLMLNVASQNLQIDQQTIYRDTYV
jgi:ABC-2 type transport system ATP-binding protein